MKHIYFSFLVLLFCSTDIYGQIIDFKKDKYWIDVGFCSYGSEDKSGSSFNLGLNVVKGDTLYKVRFHNSKESNFLGSHPTERFYCGGMMVGKEFSNKEVQMHLLSGFGITGGIKRGEFLYSKSSELFSKDYYQEDVFVTPSMLLEVGFIIKLIKNLGLGITFWGNLNTEKPMFGITILQLKIGKLRK